MAGGGSAVARPPRVQLRAAPVGSRYLQSPPSRALPSLGLRTPLPLSPRSASPTKPRRPRTAASSTGRLAWARLAQPTGRQPPLLRPQRMGGGRETRPPRTFTSAHPSSARWSQGGGPLCGWICNEIAATLSDDGGGRHHHWWFSREVDRAERGKEIGRLGQPIN